MVPSLLCTFVAHIIFLHVFFLSPFPSLSRSFSISHTLSLFLSLRLPPSPSPSPSLSLSLSLSPTIHRLSFTTTILRAAWKTSFSLSGQPSSSFQTFQFVLFETVWNLCFDILHVLHVLLPQADGPHSQRWPGPKRFSVRAVQRCMKRTRIHLDRLG